MNKSAEPPAKICRLCGKQCIGSWFLLHVRFAHSAAWENWFPDKGSFGFTVHDHIETRHLEDQRRR
jgi:hypothetical protein